MTLALCPLLCCLGLLSSPGPTVDEELPRLEVRDRRQTLGEVEIDAQVGFLRVPERRDEENSPVIRLALCRLISTADEPGPPLIYLAGGPGSAATPLAGSPAWLPFLERADVILLDQRGVGRSEPSLVWTDEAVRPAAFFMDFDTALDHAYELAEMAREDYASQGIDLSHYHTRESADDVDALRQCLGASKVCLMGHSYGTILGQAVLRQAPGTVERFVAVGTAGMNDMMKLPLDLDAGLQLLSDLAAQDPAIADQLPDLYAGVTELMQRLDHSPWDITIQDQDGSDIEIPLGTMGLQSILLRDISDTADLPVFPRLVHSMLQGDPSTLRWFLQRRHDQARAFPVLTYVNRTASGATDQRWALIDEQAEQSLFGRTRCLFAPDIADAFELDDLGDEFRAPVHSEVPTLFVSGSLDNNTPPELAEQIRQGFPHSVHVVVRNAGHEDLMGNLEVQQRMLRFLRGEDLVDEELLAPPLRFAPLEGTDPAAPHPSMRR